MMTPLPEEWLVRENAQNQYGKNIIYIPERQEMPELLKKLYGNKL
jgi:hypothetical protein